MQAQSSPTIHPPRVSLLVCRLAWSALAVCALFSGAMLGLDMTVGIVHESTKGSALVYVLVVFAGLSGLFVHLLPSVCILTLLVWFWRFGRGYESLPILSQNLSSGQAAAMCFVPILGWVVPYQLTAAYWDKTGGGPLPTAQRLWWPVFFVGEVIRRIDALTMGEELTAFAPISQLLMGLGAVMFVKTLRRLSERRGGEPLRGGE